MKEVFLLLGSNRGDRHELLKQARELIGQKAGTIVQTSTIHETLPWGFEDEISFLNQALEIDTLLSPEKLMLELLSIEKQLGRVRPLEGCGCLINNTEPGYQGRTMDIDILFFGNRLVFTETLMIPHPRLHERLFALSPLSEIAPRFIHPVLKKTIQEMKENV